MAPLEIESVVATRLSSQLQTQCNTPVVAMQTASLPSGFPNVLDSPMSWIGNQYSDENSYVVMLNDEDLAEVNTALVYFKSKFSF